ncbi:condensation domain protein [Collimonas fungivorans]|uniref:Condensation domain protein n=1 Tax=Collimonas fungivorans TaxID=158899 RepID=A0A127P6E9_9BURK|nr:condensation domain protein [Collimonas fungivorans]
MAVGRRGDLRRFHQGVLVRTPAGLLQQELQVALQALLQSHPALRLRLVRSEHEGQAVGLQVVELDDQAGARSLTRVDMSGLQGQGWLGALQAGNEAALGRLDPWSGCMLQAVWYDAGEQEAGRLRLVIHHFAVDGVSWRILLPELQAAWQAARSGQFYQGDTEGTSYGRWARQLAEQAHSASRQQELEYWQAQGESLQQPEALLGLRALDASRDTYASAGSLTVQLAPADTALLLGTAPGVIHGSVNDLLLGALVLALQQWRERRGLGGAGVRIDLESHGREEGRGQDLSRTVGWFTSLFPVHLHAQLSTEQLRQALAGQAALGWH